jgi:hypothetical protein
MAINIHKEDLLAYFTEKNSDPHAGIVIYALESSDGELQIYVDHHNDLIGLSLTTPMGTAINVVLYNITSAPCKREDGTVKFYFYQGSRPDPIAEMMVEPSVYINVDVQS